LAGARTAILSEDAVATIHELAGSSLRDIDRLAATTLVYAASRRVKSIDAGLVKAVHELGRPRTA
jgi:hypothetical protein